MLLCHATHAAVRVHHSLSANTWFLIASVSREALGSQHCQRNCIRSPDFSQHRVPHRVESRRGPGSISLSQFPLLAVVPFSMYSHAPERVAGHAFEPSAVPGVHPTFSIICLSQSFRRPLKCLEFVGRSLNPFLFLSRHVFFLVPRDTVSIYIFFTPVKRVLGTLPPVFPASPPLVRRSFSFRFLVS